jgi:uncharacterized YccA/Bax inhibitor family protein
MRSIYWQALRTPEAACAPESLLRAVPSQCKKKVATKEIEMAKQRQASGSLLVASNFERLAQTFPGQSSATATDESPGYGAANTAEYLPIPNVPPPPPMTGGASTYSGVGRSIVTDTAPFVAADVYNKVGILAAIAIAGGAITYLFQISFGAALVFLLIAFGLALVTTFRPHQAKMLAPAYAFTEGLALGGISRYFEASSKGIVPLAILFTGVIFIGTLGAYRAGLVKVGRRFIVGTTIATVGLLAVLIAASFGAPVPGASGVGVWSVVIGVVYLFVAVANLFVDFSYVEAAQGAGVSAEGEWYAAFSIMLALVMVYIAMLRILMGRR